MNSKCDEHWELFERARQCNYESGRFVSKHYTKEELAEKRKYYESVMPHEEAEMNRERWLYEIKRQFELSRTFDKYPDAHFAWLDCLIKFGY